MNDKERADALETEVAGLKSQIEKLTASAATAVADDRERRAAIMSLPETKGREALADHLFTAGMTADAAKATLAVAPKAEEANQPEYHPPRMNGQGLNREPAGGKPQAKSGLTTLVDARLAATKR